ncbi:MAG: biopolymer transporter ExbD [Bacteroidetes bacterium]|nr:biopolymer transporter ExbD [Bacteroidota bacterium]
MAEISTEGKGGKHKGKSKKVSTRVDLTPMVDLAFLLITFFMLTTSMLKPQTMEIAMPSKDKVDLSKIPPLKNSLAVTVILGKNDKIFYYFGALKDTKTGIEAEVKTIDFGPNGIRKVLLDRNRAVVDKVNDLRKQNLNRQISDDTLKARVSREKGVKDAPMVLIKATDDSSYKNLVDILDEMMICNIGKYAIIEITPEDLDKIKTMNL